MQHILKYFYKDYMICLDANKFLFFKNEVKLTIINNLSL